MSNDESESTQETTSNELKPIKPNEVTIRLEDAARAYGNTPTMREAIRLSSMFREQHYKDTVDATKWGMQGNTVEHAQGGIIDADYQVMGSERDCSIPNLEPTNAEVRNTLQDAALKMAQATPWTYEQCYAWLKSQVLKQQFGASIHVYFDELSDMKEEDWNVLFERLNVRTQPPSATGSTPKRKADWTKGLERQRRHKPK